VGTIRAKFWTKAQPVTTQTFTSSREREMEMEIRKHSTEQQRPQTALAQQPKRQLIGSPVIVAKLGNLALMLAEPMDPQGMRLTLMADNLGDLPTAAVEYAIDMWGRGDKSHLRGDLRDDVRIGVFFPKPCELREIANFYLREQRELARQRDEAEERKRQEANLLRERRKERPDLFRPRPLPCPRCGEAITALELRELGQLARRNDEHLAQLAGVAADVPGEG
jgi:hypothetical protein